MLSMWRVEMCAGQQGPPHVFDTEQIWHLLAGQAQVSVGTEQLVLSAATPSCCRQAPNAR
jgi:quercetin dioxygenase-like cupin family protein